MTRDRWAIRVYSLDSDNTIGVYWLDANGKLSFRVCRYKWSNRHLAMKTLRACRKLYNGERYALVRVRP